MTIKRDGTTLSRVDRIQELCDEHSPKITIAELERKLNLSNGSIRRWSDSSPRSESLAKVAKYFGVSMDYLDGQTDIKEKADDLVSLAAHHDGEEWTEEDLRDLENFKQYLRMRKKELYDE